MSTTHPTSAHPTSAHPAGAPAPAITYHLPAHRVPRIDHVPPAEAADPWVIAPDDAHRLLAGAPWRRLVVLGDSVPAGVGDPVDGYLDLSWADRVAAALDRVNPGLSYLNVAERELRAAEVRQLQLGPAMAFRPDLAVVVCGGNDMLSRSFDAASVEYELEIMISRLREQGADVVTFGLFDLSKTSFIPDEMRDGLRQRLHLLGDVTRQVSRRHGGIHVDFLTHPVGADDTAYSADKLHANRRGHAVVATETIRWLGSTLRWQLRPAG
jgi:lysophospholipase L1-like esterase